MRKSLFKDSFDWNGETTIQNWYSADNFQNDSYRRIRLYIVKNDNLLLVEKNDNTFQIPGGGIEGNETPEEAVIREVLEEVNAVVNPKYLVPICILESYRVSDKDNKTYELHYIIDSDSIEFKEFESDPAGKIVGNKFVKLAEIDDYLNWGKKAQFLSKFLLDHLSKRELQN